MSEPGRSQDHPSDARSEEAPPPPTPFDHPLFLPALLLAFCAWFGYDGYLNQNPEMLEHLAFNRFGFRLLLYCSLYFGAQGWAELRGRELPPLLGSALLAAMALWFAASGWLSEDALDREYAGFHQHTSLVLAGLAAVQAWTGARRVRGGGETLLASLALPLGLALAAVSYGCTAGTSSAALASGIACAGSGALAIWLAIRRFRGRRRRAAEGA